jgi:hypothetical protein
MEVSKLTNELGLHWESTFLLLVVVFAFAFAFIRLLLLATRNHKIISIPASATSQFQEPDT